MWTDQAVNQRPIVPGLGNITNTQWNVSVQAVDEYLGGTFYRPQTADWIQGTVAPGYGTGHTGNEYLDTAHYMWYGPKKIDGTWGTGHHLPSPHYGKVYINGSGAPTPLLGNEGDYYLDVSNYVYYGPKTSDGWGSKLYMYDSYIHLTKGPLPTGWIYFPDSQMIMTDSVEGSVEVYAMMENAAGESVVPDLLIGSLAMNPAGLITVQGESGVVLRYFSPDDVLADGVIERVRFRISGPKGLKWSFYVSSLMGKLSV